MKKKGILIVLLVLAVILAAGSMFTVAEDEYACTVRFSKIIDTTSEAGLHFKLPFVDSVKYFTDATQLYDIPPSEVLTSDKQNMTVDCYILWRISDPKLFYQTLGSTAKAEERLDAITYSALKTDMGTLAQADIINMNDGAERNTIYDDITVKVDAAAKSYGIHVEDVKIKRFDLPESNLNAVYGRMISERNQMAEKYTADGNYDASIIRNDVDKQVNIIVSDAGAAAAKLEAEGEQEYMRLLAKRPSFWTPTPSLPRSLWAENRDQLKKPAHRSLDRCAGFVLIALFPKTIGVLALVGHPAQGGYHRRLVGGVGHAVPFVGGSQHRDRGLLLRDQLGHRQRQEEFTLDGVLHQRLVQKSREAGFQLLQEAGGVAPQVHGYGGVGGDVHPVLAVLGEVDAAGVLFHTGTLVNAGEMTLAVGDADAPGDAAVVRHGLAQLVAHHVVIVGVLILRVAEGVVNHPVGGGAVIVVGVDDRKGRVADGLTGAQNRVAGAPWLGASLRDGVAGGDIVQLLIGVTDLHGAFFQSLADGLHEVLADGFLDDDNGGIETGFVGVIKGIVQNRFALTSHRVDLLQSAVAAAHTGGHNDENRFACHSNSPFLFFGGTMESGSAACFIGVGSL